MASNQVSNSPVPTVVDPKVKPVDEKQHALSSVSENLGDNYSPKNPEKSKASSSGDVTLKQSGTALAFHQYRFQISMQNGYFTNVLKDELLNDLNNSLYQLPSGSFIPSFNSYGLRFGKLWFSPENEESSIWLKKRLAEINEKAVDGCKFFIETYGLHQNKVCLNIPLISNECLNEADILKRLHFQNPSLGIEQWKILRTKLMTASHRLVICAITDCSFNLLKSMNSRLNYGFQKILCKPYMERKSSKPKN